MNKTSSTKAVGLIDVDSLGMVSRADLAEQSPLLIPDSVPILNILDAGLTRVSRVQLILRTLEHECADDDKSVFYGHLTGMLAGAYLILNTVGIRLGGES